MEISNFGRNLKALRDREKISQYQLADILEITQATVSNWETGGKKPRSKELIKSICDKFSVSENDLFGFSDGLYAKLNGLESAPASAPLADPASVRFSGADLANRILSEDVMAKLRDSMEDSTGRSPKSSEVAEALMLRLFRADVVGSEQEKIVESMKRSEKEAD